MQTDAKRVLIIGADGQDGVCLRQLMERSDREVWCVTKDHLWKEGSPTRQPFSVLEPENLTRHFERFPPEELYYLAAYHHSSQERAKPTDHELWHKSMEVNVQGWVNCLLAVKQFAQNCRAVYAASSHVFGVPSQVPQTEMTPFNPVNIYGVSKVAGIQAARFYRGTHQLHASCAILYNHESTFRTEKFVSQKIIRSLYRVKAGQQKELVLGDLHAVVDWGFAPDYVDALRRIVALDKPDDFIVATGERHTVFDFVQLVCEAIGLEMNQVVREDRQLLGAGYGRSVLMGDSSKLRGQTGWVPSVTFPQMVHLLSQTP